jgi:ribulose-5-phosphate 4-epimerase/fuculose-1-phosphate aldolase
MKHYKICLHAHSLILVSLSFSNFTLKCYVTRCLITIATIVNVRTYKKRMSGAINTLINVKSVEAI